MAISVRLIRVSHQCLLAAVIGFLPLPLSPFFSLSTLPLCSVFFSFSFPPAPPLHHPISSIIFLLQFFLHYLLLHLLSFPFHTLLSPPSVPPFLPHSLLNLLFFLFFLFLVLLHFLPVFVLLLHHFDLLHRLCLCPLPRLTFSFFEL